MRRFLDLVGRAAEALARRPEASELYMAACESCGEQRLFESPADWNQWLDAHRCGS